MDGEGEPISGSLVPLLLAILATFPQPCGVVRDRCECIEVNEFLEPSGFAWDNDGQPVPARQVLRQVIFWEGSTDEGTALCRDWRIFKADIEVSRTAEGCRVLFRDGDVLREITAKTLRVSQTDHDPETANRNFLACERRRKFGGVR